jgi:predicted metal-dependent hydrolase
MSFVDSTVMSYTICSCNNSAMNNFLLNVMLFLIRKMVTILREDARERQYHQRRIGPPTDVALATPMKTSWGSCSV